MKPIFPAKIQNQTFKSGYIELTKLLSTWLRIGCWHDQTTILVRFFMNKSLIFENIHLAPSEFIYKVAETKFHFSSSFYKFSTFKKENC